MRQRTTRVSLCVAAVLCAATALLSAHMKVERTFPETGSTVTAAPERLQVWFTQNPTMAISALALEGPSGTVTLGKVAAGQADGKPDRSLVAPITSRLVAGKYTASWKTSGTDGHIQTGTFEFTLAERH